MRLDHVALTVSDRDAAAAFYARYFGLENRIHEDDHLLILAGEGGSLLALSEGDVPVVPRTNHFGFRAPDAGAVLALRARFAEDGVVETEFQEAGPVRVQVADPSGNRVEAYAF